MKNNYLALSFGVVAISSIILLFSCKKINEATELGGDLIPPVDNVTTFDTLLEVQVFNDSFTVANDSTQYGVGLYNGNYEMFLGHINNDPFFGRTDAKLSFQLKPSYFKWNFPNVPDSLHIDSVVLVLDYLETYGDSLMPQTVNVYEIDQASNFKINAIDSQYKVRENTVINGALLGSRTFRPMDLDDSVKAYLDTTANQLRIRLDNAFGQRLLEYDSTAGDAYSGDSAFNSKFKGFTLETVSGGDAVMGFNLTGAGTKLALYYHYDHDRGGTDKFDTTVTYFSFATSSASANYVRRDYSGTPFAASVGGTAPDNYVYIQNTPGSFATIKIPGLAGLDNRIVHRAELIMEQAYDIKDSTFSPPDYLYLDAYDPAESAFRTIPYDVYYDASGSLNLGSFGSLPYITTDPLGNVVRNWRFNLTRYVQHIVNGTEAVYDLRLYAPLYTFNQYKATANSASSKQLVFVNSNIAKGRVRLYGNDGTPANPQRMRLRIVYSKI